MTVLRGNAGEVATLVGVEAEVRGVESIGAGGDPAELAREAARDARSRRLGHRPVDHVSDGERAAAVSNGHELLATVTGTGCMSTAITGASSRKDDPFEAAAEALVAFGVAGEDAAARGEGPGHLPRRALRRARRARSGDPDAGARGLVRLHALVADARRPAPPRTAGRPSSSCGSRARRPRRSSRSAAASRELGASSSSTTTSTRRSSSAAASISARPTPGASGRRGRAPARHLRRKRREAAVAEYAGATYVGAGPVWATPSKPDAGEPIGLDGLARDLPRRLRSRRRDRRDRRLERGRLHPRRRLRSRRHPRGRRDRGAAGGGRCGSLTSASSASSRARAPRADRRDRARRGASSPAGSSSRRTRSSRASTSGSTGSRGASSASGPRRSTSATSSASGGAAGGAPRHARRCPATSSWSDVLELYEGIAEAGVPVVGGDTTQRRHARASASPRSAAPSACPGRAGARPGDLLVVTGPLGGAGAAFRRGPLRPPAAADGGGPRAGAARTRCSTSPTGSPSTPATSPAAPAAALVIDLERVPLATGELDDLGFGEDFELLAATPDPLGFAVIGRCEEGEGVVLLHAGRAVRPPGYEHFVGLQPAAQAG